MNITIRYPFGADHVLLRTSMDWDRDVAPVERGPEHAVFEVEFAESFLMFKPCLVRAGRLSWSRGSNYVVSRHDPDPEAWPFFFAEPCGHVGEELHFERDGHSHAVRAYLPPGYDENTLRHYPVLYMQDGRNLFFPHEAFGGREWQVDETMDRLDQMNAVRKVIVVGIAPIDRMKDYTRPGYAAYAQFVADTIKPAIDRKYRTRTAPADTVAMGSSLGGVVSLFLAWQHPHIFGGAACLSSTFGFEDDLFERIASETRRSIRIYLDSGWPRDNFDATNAMRDLLVHRGYQLGVDVLQFSFPEGFHSENSWASRIHMPFQFFFGRAWAATRS
ncbi:MAG: alpha/beta hydrolase [Myxococcales bacterium]|nr:alpha/beta hydrolase [Myxococcales bacterium]